MQTFFARGLFRLNSQGSEHRGRLLPAEFTMDNAAKCLLMPIGKIDPFTKTPFMHGAATASTYRQMCTKHTRDTVSQIGFSHRLSCSRALEKSYPLHACDVFGSFSCGRAEDVHPVALHYKEQKTIWRQKMSLEYEGF